MDSMRSLPGDGGGCSGYKGTDGYTVHVRAVVLGFYRDYVGSCASNTFCFLV